MYVHEVRYENPAFLGQQNYYYLFLRHTATEDGTEEYYSLQSQVAADSRFLDGAFHTSGIMRTTSLTIINDVHIWLFCKELALFFVRSY